MPVATAQPPGATAIRPFTIEIPDADLADLGRRLAATRWPTKELVEDRSQGVQLATLKELVRYWAMDYDWRKAETKLNALPQFVTKIDGVDIHFIRSWFRSRSSRACRTGSRAVAGTPISRDCCHRRESPRNTWHTPCGRLRACTAG